MKSIKKPHILRASVYNDAVFGLCATHAVYMHAFCTLLSYFLVNLNWFQQNIGPAKKHNNNNRQPNHPKLIYTKFFFRSKPFTRRPISKCTPAKAVNAQVKTTETLANKDKKRTTNETNKNCYHKYLWCAELTLRTA